MEANVKFTNEFKAKTRKKLGNTRKKELRLQCLADAEKDGKLDKAKTRYDVAKLAGFTDKQKQSGYLWVYKQVKAGTIIEHIADYRKNGTAEYEYHIANPLFAIHKIPAVEKRAMSKPVNVTKVLDTLKFGETLKPKSDTIKLTSVHPKAIIRLSRIEIVLEDMKLEDIAILAHTLNKED